MNILKRIFYSIRYGLKKFFIAIGRGFKNFFAALGFRKTSRYVANYLNDANLRSGAFMSVVIVLLEIYVIARQFHDKILPRWASGAMGYTFDSIYKYTNGFWLLLAVGLCMTVFCLTYKRMKTSNTKVLVVNTILSATVFAFSFFIIKIFALFPSSYTWDNKLSIINGTLLILEYSIAFLFALCVFGAVLYRKITGKASQILAILVITFFSAICLVFGVKVSYSDFISGKEVMCFLTMMVYVGCLLIWRPYISVGILGTLFLGFYLLLRTFLHGPDNVDVGMGGGDTVNYFTFFVSLTMVCISIYHQRYKEATKDEELEYIAHYDELSGLNNFAHFLNATKEMVSNQNVAVGSKIFLFINLDSFKNYNDQRGFIAGNAFLKKFGQEIVKAFPKSLVCREASDHFVVFADVEDFKERLEVLSANVTALDEDIKPKIHAGGYIFSNRDEEPRRAVDKARYACSVASKGHQVIFVEYDKQMHNGYHLMQYIIRHLDEAIEKGWIRPYYQPVAWSKTGEICGAEALVRWIDPGKGLLSPGSFVPTLESTKLIHKLDACIFESVCRDIRRVIDEGKKPVPVSLNFSRLDFQLMDAIGYLEKIVKKYNIPKNLLHVEVTESALMEDETLLKKSVNALQSKGYAVWLDDFGSGYSSLNVLKDYSFDVLKIDMVFLKGFGQNEKSKIVIKSIIDMANLIGMRTLTEGVETQEHVDFLREAGCERLQGYHFSEPISFEDFQAKIEKGEFRIAENID